jgi:hypothetical protein
MMSYPCIYNEEGKCKLYSTVYEHSWCVEGPCDDQTLSNGDKIRSMTDEELAEFLCGVYDEEETDKFICGTIIPNYYEEAICDWLKQPAEV